MANEKRLIDANGLKAEFTGNFHEMWHYTGIRAMIDVQPTVDAVEVVRCKDCKHYHADTLSCDFTPHSKYYERPNWYEDDFCSYGERKDNES